MPSLAATAIATGAATAPAGAGSGLLFLVLIAVTFGYLFLCWLWPFTACRRCHGTGKRPAWIGSGFRYCPRCDGTGHALRIGRRLINALRDIHTRAR